MIAKRAYIKRSSVANKRHTDELIPDKYYTIPELAILTKTNKQYWYNYTSIPKYPIFPPLLVKREKGRVYLKGSEAIRILNRPKSKYSKDFIQNSIRIPSFAKGNVIEMCVKVAIIAENEKSKRIWAATAIYAYRAMLADAYEKEELRLPNGR